MKIRPALSLVALAPVLLITAGARAQDAAAPPAKVEEVQTVKVENTGPTEEIEETQEVEPPPTTVQEVTPIMPRQMPEPYQPPPAQSPDVATGELPEMPEPYRPPSPESYDTGVDPYATAADPSQIDWPQDIAAEEATVDSYDDGYDPQAYTHFENDLAPYGDWIDDGTYGRVWVPSASMVGPDFTPYYSNGHWALTEFGWTWVSHWNWGWAPFHYGRWILSGFGWAWVPGTMWGPAWVSWRSGGGYVGWAGLPPRGVSVTSTYGHRTPWRFTRASDLGAKRLNCLPMRDMKGMFRRTTNVANDRVLTRGAASVHINAGPRFIPGATVARLKTVAPHAFPQRTILPRPGAAMSARPWIRAATAGAAPMGGGPRIGNGPHIGGGPRIGNGPHIGGGPRVGGGPRISGGAGAGPAPTFGGSFASPRIYNPPRPPGPSTPGVYQNNPASRTLAPPAHANRPSFADTNIGPRVFDATPRNTPTFTPTHSPTHVGVPAPTRPMQTITAPPVSNPARVYNPPPRAFDVPPTINPTRAFSGSAGVYNPPQHAPMQPLHQAHTPPQIHLAPHRAFSAPAPQRSFSAPAPQPSFSAPAPQPSFSAPAQRSFSAPAPQPSFSAPAQRSFSAPPGGGHGRPGGGMPFGGPGHRR